MKTKFKFNPKLAMKDPYHTVCEISHLNAVVKRDDGLYECKLLTGETVIVDEDGIGDNPQLTMYTNPFPDKLRNDSIDYYIKIQSLVNKMIKFLNGLIKRKPYNFYEKVEDARFYIDVKWAKQNYIMPSVEKGYYSIVSLCDTSTVVGEHRAMVFQPTFAKIMLYTGLRKKDLKKLRNVFKAFIKDFEQLTPEEFIYFVDSDWFRDMYNLSRYNSVMYALDIIKDF